MKPPRQWYRLESRAGEVSTDVYIYGDIGRSYWDEEAVSAKQFVDELTALPKEISTVRVHVNSLGGDMFDGLAIANTLRDQRGKGRTIETICEGVAASAGSLVMMAGAPIRMGDNATMMIHDPYGFVIGNAAELRKNADLFDSFRDQLVTTYMWNATVSAEEIVAMMAAETWLSADQAIEKGLATEKVEGLKAVASLDSRSLAKLKVPDQYRARVDALLKREPAPPPAPMAADATEVLRICRENGCLDLAEELVTAKATVATVTAKVTEARTARAAAAQRASDITALCKAQKLPELADGYIAGAMSLDAVRAHITIITAKVDHAEIDGGLLPDRGATPTARLSTSEIYAARNRAPQ